MVMNMPESAGPVFDGYTEGMPSGRPNRFGIGLIASDDLSFYWASPQTLFVSESMSSDDESLSSKGKVAGALSAKM
jgi:hypothetical protein